VVAGRWSSGAAVGAVCFPEVTAGLASVRRPILRTVALARLIEGSLDRWDGPTIPSHVGLLEALVLQARSYVLSLGQEMSGLTESLAEPW
jgi:hypothetical protein